MAPMIALMLARLGVWRPLSKSLTVERSTPARPARTVWLQLRNPRAARHCSLVIIPEGYEATQLLSTNLVDLRAKVNHFGWVKK